MSELALRPDEAWPTYAEDEIAAVAAVLRSGKVNQWTGPDVAEFERACTKRFGGGHGIAVANGSLALDLALLAFEIGPGDEVIVTPRSFAASAFCVMLAGATPVFADVDPESGNITAETIERVMTERTRAIIPVHLAGWPADMPAILELARRRNVLVIEDCAQAHGATIGGQSVGSFGDAAAWSFCQDKIISTGGEGGFVSFKDGDRADWAWSFKDHGKNRDKIRHGSGPPGVFRFVHDMPGTNWRLTGPQAAIGLAQLGKLGEWTRLRERTAGIWLRELNQVEGIRAPQPASGVRHAYYKLYLYLKDSGPEAAQLRNRIVATAQEQQLRVFSGSCSEIYREEAFEGLAHAPCPVAQGLGDTSLMVEVHPTLDPGLLEQRARQLAHIVSETLC
jgi:dTDP-4-amino-4,6-dideoxygalactose transaminase